MGAVVSQTNVLRTADLDARESELWTRYWEILNFGLPPEWLADERKQMLADLKELRDLEAQALNASIDAGDLVEVENRQPKYEALVMVFPEDRAPAAPAPARGEGER